MGKIAVFGGMAIGLSMCIAAMNKPDEGNYTSPLTQYNAETLAESNRTGVPLEDVRAKRSDERRIAIERTLSGR